MFAVKYHRVTRGYYIPSQTALDGNRSARSSLLSYQVAKATSDLRATECSDQVDCHDELGRTTFYESPHHIRHRQAEPWLVS